ncbi:MAG: hypothetical protein EBS06_09550 [Proteobacteria bacterium]|nr:hypothetical protein [Pseudomonadota bacterium]
MNNFKNNYENNKCIFYHFLDGYINDSSGYRSDYVLDFIKKNIFSKYNLDIVFYNFNNNNFGMSIKKCMSTKKNSLPDNINLFTIDSDSDSQKKKINN